MGTVRRNHNGRIVRNLPYKTKLAFRKNAPDQCNICGQKSDHYEIDHILPIRDGGDDSLDNLQLLCYECHKIKSAQEMNKRNNLSPAVHINSETVEA